MKPLDQNLFQFSDALPQEFDFYHLGKVKQEPSHEDFKEYSAVAFQFYGEWSAILVLLFSKELDFDLYAEMGNILASRIVMQLNQEKGLDLMISPPQVIQEKTLERMTQNAKLVLHHSYTHLYQNSVIPVKTLLFSTQAEGNSYA